MQQALFAGRLLLHEKHRERRFETPPRLFLELFREPLGLLPLPLPSVSFSSLLASLLRPGLPPPPPLLPPGLEQQQPPDRAPQLG